MPEGREQHDAGSVSESPEEGAASLEGLDARDRSILRTLVPGEAGRVAFQGLRRRLDLHQQSLARTLDRLQRYDLVGRDDDGYFLTDEGARAAGTDPDLDLEGLDPVAEGLLPPNFGAEAVLDHLAGRWFTGLRWYGWTSTPGETSLVWLGTPDRVLVRLRVSDDAFRIEADVGEPPNPDAFDAARVLLQSLAEVFGVPREPGRGALWERKGAAS